jgi:hypothetical protein
MSLLTELRLIEKLGFYKYCTPVARVGDMASLWG